MRSSMVFRMDIMPYPCSPMTARQPPATSVVFDFSHSMMTNTSDATQAKEFPKQVTVKSLFAFITTYTSARRPQRPLRREFMEDFRPVQLPVDDKSFRNQVVQRLLPGR